MSQRIKLEPVGIVAGFYGVHIDGEHCGYISWCPLNGYELYAGNDWSTSKLIDRSFNLQACKQWALEYLTK